MGIMSTDEIRETGTKPPMVKPHDPSSIFLLIFHHSLPILRFRSVCDWVQPQTDQGGVKRPLRIFTHTYKKFGWVQSSLRLSFVDSLSFLTKGNTKKKETRFAGSYITFPAPSPTPLSTIVREARKLPSSGDICLHWRLKSAEIFISLTPPKI